jgi:AraC-like DNA-binding protein
VGLGQTAIGNIEVDQRGYGVSIIDIARVLRVSPAYLRQETNDPTQDAPAPVIEAPKYPLTPEAVILARLFDRISRDTSEKLMANQICLQAIIDALQQLASAPPQRQVSATSEKKQAA